MILDKTYSRRFRLTVGDAANGMRIIDGKGLFEIDETPVAYHRMEYAVFDFTGKS